MERRDTTAARFSEFAGAAFIATVCVAHAEANPINLANRTPSWDHWNVVGLFKEVVCANVFDSKKPRAT